MLMIKKYLILSETFFNIIAFIKVKIIPPLVSVYPTIQDIPNPEVFF